MASGTSTADVRRRLVHAAIGQLADEGMKGLTHRKVEQRAELAQGLVKYHFGSLDGLIEAVLAHLAVLGFDNVMQVPQDVVAESLGTGVVPDSIWREARRVIDKMTSDQDVNRARFELFLHAKDRPELQAIIRRERDRFVDFITAVLPGAQGEAAARMLMAMIDGVLLHQISAPSEVVEEMAPAYLLGTISAGLLLPALEDLPPAARR
ncbi:TetR/AcrR family transcriptional regulator [Nostocoides australiense]|nr:TetR/AcrR family transcriptional regulator [Tetrasphaera australiensis]